MNKYTIDKFTNKNLLINPKTYRHIYNMINVKCITTLTYKYPYENRYLETNNHQEFHLYEFELFFWNEVFRKHVLPCSLTAYRVDKILLHVFLQLKRLHVKQNHSIKHQTNNYQH